MSIAFNVGITMRPAPAVGASEEECGNMLSGALSALRSRRLFPSLNRPSPQPLLLASLSILSSCVQSLRAETVLGRAILTTLFARAAALIPACGLEYGKTPTAEDYPRMCGIAACFSALSGFVADCPRHGGTPIARSALAAC